MKTSGRGQGRWMVRAGLVMMWVVATAAWAQGPPEPQAPAPRQSSPQGGVPQVTQRPTFTPAPVPATGTAPPTQATPTDVLGAAAPVAGVQAGTLPVPVQAPATGTAPAVGATGGTRASRQAAARQAAARRRVTPSFTNNENPVFQPAVVPGSPAAQVTVPVVAPGSQALPSTSATGSTTTVRGAARPAAAVAVQAGSATPSAAPAHDPPPPYPLQALTPAPEPTVPGVDLNPNAIPVPQPAPPPEKRKLLQKIVPVSPNVADSSLNQYVERVRRETSNAIPTSGSIWTESGRLTRLNTDVRAMRPNDLIQVVVLENLAASTDGTVKNQRASTANSSISSLIGALHAGNALQNLVNQSSANSLNATGASATNSSLSTTFGGQVIEVLPNGMLVIEAARQVEFSQQTQTIILRGLVRPEDISQENQVISTAISSLELQVKGKGIVNDYTHRQNPLVRLLEQILIF